MQLNFVLKTNTCKSKEGKKKGVGSEEGRTEGGKEEKTVIFISSILGRCSHDHMLQRNLAFWLSV